MSRVETDVLLSGRYRLARRLASGGMGQVWEAEDTVLNRTVAVKILSDGLSSDATSAERFRREAQAAAGLSHPNVAGVFDYGEDDGTQFIVMELVAGETLAERIRRGELEPGEAARIAGEIAAALEVAHEAGVVHRDIKPGNVMLTGQGEVKVLDFGIAAASAHDLTATGITIGTAAYLSPEQAAGERATSASDVYSLGVVLYEMLVGRPPFKGESPVAVAAAHVSQEAPSLAEEFPGVPPHLALLCQRALAKEPASRPRSAGDFRRMLAGDQAISEATATLAPVDSSTSPKETTAVLPAPDATAVLSKAEPWGDKGQRERPGPTRRATPPRNRTIWVLAAILTGMVLLAFVLSRALGSDLSSPKNQAEVKVPSVVGLKLGDAVKAVRGEGLKVGDVKRVDGPADFVVRTDPPGGASAAPGASVTLYVGAQPQSSNNGDKGKGKDKGKGRGGD
jgi:eukaryotic-like serine/threonine-protein kinase